MPLEASAQMWPLSPRLPLARTSGHTAEPDGGGEAPQGAGPWAGRKTLFRERKRKTPAGRPCVDPEATGGTGGRGAWSGLATVTPRGRRERAGHPWAPPSCPAGDQSFSCPEDALPQQRMRVRGCIRGGEQCGSAGTPPPALPAPAHPLFLLPPAPASPPSPSLSSLLSPLLLLPAAPHSLTNTGTFLNSIRASKRCPLGMPFRRGAGDWPDLSEPPPRAPRLSVCAAESPGCAARLPW